ncbi:MAG: Wzz/FepE/Etk N-terminal domain-containing protein [Candidatus Omnitrophica bacterium]|nr:Wzz/FepE/Etk N-terminal domain-containing protein [Candidatus Omnitrophota bacterium]
MMDSHLHVQEDGVDLKKYISILVKRKKLILGIFLITIAISAVASFFIPKVYEITSTIQLGNINGPLISKEESKEIILNQNAISDLINKLNLKLGVEGLKRSINISSINGTNLLTVKIIYSDLAEAFKIHDVLLDPLIAQGKKIYQERIFLVNERLKELDAEISNSEQDISRTQALIAGLPNASNISQSDVSLRIILLQNTLPNYENNLTSLRDQRNNLKYLLSNARDFMVFDKPIKPENAMGPDKKQKIITAGVLSLVFGILLAFFLEYWQKDKQK